MAYFLVVHKHAAADLQGIRQTSEEAARRIGALLHELKCDPDLLDRLTQQGYGAEGTSTFNICMWGGEQKRGRNLWRLKIWDLERAGLKYRIVYAFEPKLQRYKILAIAPRDFDYDEAHPLTQRIRADYDKV